MWKEAGNQGTEEPGFTSPIPENIKGVSGLLNPVALGALDNWSVPPENKIQKTGILFSTVHFRMGEDG